MPKLCNTARALNLKSELLRQEPGNIDYQRLVAWGQNDLAKLLNATGDPAAALPLNQAAVATFQQIAASNTASRQFQLDTGFAQLDLADSYYGLGRCSEALSVYKTALPLLHSAHENGPFTQVQSVALDRADRYSATCRAGLHRAK